MFYTFVACNILWSFVGSSEPSGYPYYNYPYILKENGFDNRLIERLNKMTMIMKFFQNTINSTLFYSFDW